MKEPSIISPIVGALTTIVLRHAAVGFGIIASAACCAHTVEAQSWMTESGTAEFTSSIPFHTFTGRSDHLTGIINLADSTVDFYVDLSSLKTGIGKRDKDMRLTLNVKEYPFAEFYGVLVTGFDPTEHTMQQITVTGNFTLHGVTKSVEISGTLQMRENKLEMDVAWDLNLADYDIVPPRLLIVKVDEIQKIHIFGKLNPTTSQ